MAELYATWKPDPTAELLIKGLTQKELESGAMHMQLHYSADPDKDEAWAAQERKNVIDPREWAVQMEMQELHLDGKPVYPTFDEELHAPAQYASRKIPVVAGAQFVCGWDCGNTVHPAFQLLQIARVMPGWKMIMNLGELVAVEAGTHFTDFLPAVSSWMSDNYPSVLLTHCVHGADESGQARNGVTGKSAFEAALEYGLAFQPVANQGFARRDAVAKLLADRQPLEDGFVAPRFMLSRMMSPLTFKGFQGGYRLKPVAIGNATTYGDPVKDIYSHPHDALQYGAVMALDLLDRDSQQPQKRRR